MTYVSNSRHIGLLTQALNAIKEVQNGIEMGIPIDILQIDLTRTWELLGEIIGDSVHDELNQPVILPILFREIEKRRWLVQTA